MSRRKEDFLLFMAVVSTCIRSIHSQYDYHQEPEFDQSDNQEISVKFPKYNIKIAPVSQGRPRVIFEEVPSSVEGYYNEEEQMPAAPVSEEVWTNYDVPYQNQPIYHVQQEVQPHIYRPEPTPHYPIITREPIETKSPCIYYQYPPEYYTQGSEIDVPHPYKQNTDWMYNQSPINLRAADPRAIISSHTHFVKVKEPVFGTKKVMFTHSKKIIGGHHPHSHFGGLTNIHKNTHIHLRNRNANQEKRQSNDNDRIIGSHLFAAPRWRRDTLTRRKRGIVDLAKLVVDHNSRIDFPKTAENVGAATRNIFEEEYSPVYHFTNALGAAHDSLYSFMNVRPSGILIPCRYKIVHANEAPSVATSPIVGGINPAIYNIHNESPGAQPEDDGDRLLPEDEEDPYNLPEDPSDDASDTQYIDYGDQGDPLQKIGNKLRESVQWAQKTAEHAAEMLHHTRSMVVNARKSWPKLILPYAGAVEVTRPKIGGENNDIVGTVKDPEYVGVGKMMDYLGMTDRKPDLTPRVGGPRMISEEEMILKEAKKCLGYHTYRDFLEDMKRHFNIGSAKSELVGRPRLPTNSDLQARLALNRLRSALLLHKAKGNLRRLQLMKPLRPSVPLPHKPIIKPISKAKSPLLQSINKPKPLLPVIKPPEPKKPLIPPKNEVVGSPIKIPPKQETKNPNPALEKIRTALENIKLKNSPTTPKPPSPLEKLRERLNKKYNITNDGKDNGDLLGKTLAQFKNKNPEEVGAVKTDGKFEPVPVPVLTKEMRTPFMGLATKQDLEQYFKKLYCSSCKMGDIK